MLYSPYKIDSIQKSEREAQKNMTSQKCGGAGRGPDVDRPGANNKAEFSSRLGLSDEAAAGGLSTQYPTDGELRQQ
jgi:hypothetical protein